MALKASAALSKDRMSGQFPCQMQHRHFAAIAEIIRRLPDDITGNRDRIANHFARELASTNVNFDGARFLAACDVSAEWE